MFLMFNNNIYADFRTSSRKKYQNIKGINFLNIQFLLVHVHNIQDKAYFKLDWIKLDNLNFPQ